MFSHRVVMTARPALFQSGAPNVIFRQKSERHANLRTSASFLSQTNYQEHTDTHPSHHQAFSPSLDSSSKMCRAVNCFFATPQSASSACASVTASSQKQFTTSLSLISLFEIPARALMLSLFLCTGSDAPATLSTTSACLEGLEELEPDVASAFSSVTTQRFFTDGMFLFRLNANCERTAYQFLKNKFCCLLSILRPRGLRTQRLAGFEGIALEYGLEFITLEVFLLRVQESYFCALYQLSGRSKILP